MTNKDGKNEEQILDALLPDIETMSPEETDSLVADTGVDMRALRASLQNAAKDLASELRKGGTPAPHYLTRAIEALDDSLKLPTTSDVAALARADVVISRFRTPEPVPKNAKLLKAARFSPTATSDDRTAEKLAADLRKELDGDDTTEK